MVWGFIRIEKRAVATFSWHHRRDFEMSSRGLQWPLVQFTLVAWSIPCRSPTPSASACPAGGASYQSASADADPLLSSAPVAVEVAGGGSPSSSGSA